MGRFTKTAVRLEEKYVVSIESWLGPDNVRYFCHLKGLTGTVAPVLKLNAKRRGIPVWSVEYHEMTSVRNYLVNKFPEVRGLRYNELEDFAVRVMEEVVRRSGEKAVDENSFRLNLGDYRKGYSIRIFVGRDYGKYVRDISHFDDEFERHDVVKISVPADVYCVSPAFLESLLENVFKKYGRDVVERKIMLMSGYILKDPFDAALHHLSDSEVCIR